MGQGGQRERKGKQFPIQERLGRKIGWEQKGIHWERCISEVPIIRPNGELGSLELIEVWAGKLYLGAVRFYMQCKATKKRATLERE